jgi:hypothetical protein
MCYSWFGAYPNHMDITIIVKHNLLKKIMKKEKNKTKEKHNNTDRD